MESSGLHKLALAIGWTKVSDDDDFSSYEYRRQVSSAECVVNIVRIYNNLDIDSFLETLYIIKKVLPWRLFRKINKITYELKPEDIAGALDAVCFALEEYKAKCDYTKLCEYGALVGIDIKALGYDFQYELPKKIKKQILTLIETSIPMEQATVLAKMKKLDYKIGYLKSNQKIIEND